MRLALLLIAGSTLACGGSPRVSPEPPHSVAEHRAEAAVHEEKAAAHEAEAQKLESGGSNAYVCGDTVLFDQSTSGGERLAIRVPCWSAEVGGTRAHVRAAERERHEAARHRAVARALERAEQESCASIAPAERDHTPFWHRADILAVEPLVEDGSVHGTRVVFRRVPALTTDWMSAALRCQRARSASLGWDPRYMGYDPSLLDGTQVAVRDDDRGILVEIRAHDPDVAAVVEGRARALLAVSPRPPR
jgi:hypothetical protein